MHLNDPTVIYKLTALLIDEKSAKQEFLSSHGWCVYAEGETELYPFALLKALKNEMSDETLTIDEIQQRASDFDFSVMAQVPYFFQL